MGEELLGANLNPLQKSHLKIEFGMVYEFRGAYCINFAYFKQLFSISYFYHKL